MTLSAKIKLQIARVRLKTNRSVSSSALGARQINRSGVGFEFDQLREYQQGDDVRFIDWKGSARSGKILTKQFFAERNQRVTIALDISASSFIGHKFEWMAELAAIFTLVAHSCRDQVGLVLFSDQIDLHLPAAANSWQSQLILEQIFSCSDFYQSRPNRQTNLKQVLSQMGQTLPKRNLIFLISDLIDQADFAPELKLLRQRHDVIAVRWLDQFERNLPEVGFLPVQDPESGAWGVLDLRNLKDSNHFLDLRVQEQDRLLRRCGVDLLQICDPERAIGEIVRFFQKRLVAR